MGGGPLGYSERQFSIQKCDTLLIPDVLLGAGEAMRRRELLILFGCVAVEPLFIPCASHSQQRDTRLVGVLISASEQGYARVMGPVRGGLKQAGFVEGENLAIEYRWADYHYDRLPKLAADLVQRQVSVIFTTGSIVSALAAKSATNSIPIVFANGSDPVRYGLVASLSRPGGNMTGVTFYNSGLGPKRIGLLREILPNAAIISLLVNPKNPNAEDDAKEMQEAGRNAGVQIEIVNASAESELDEAFAKVRQLHADALIVHVDALFNAQYGEIIALAAQYAVPTMYAMPQATRAGGLISYGTDVDEMDRQAGMYIGKILKGAKPADLPVLQPTKFDLRINLKTARALRLTVPLLVQMTADEVIE
jgi:putative tryptophan/tyrosine transport system substrate-binding protein